MRAWRTDVARDRDVHVLGARIGNAGVVEQTADPHIDPFVSCEAAP